MSAIKVGHKCPSGTKIPQKSALFPIKTMFKGLLRSVFFGILIVYIKGMKIQAISQEKQLIDELMKLQNAGSQFVELYAGEKNSLDILSFVASGNASLVIMDDDFTSPNSVHLLESVKKVKKEQKIIFLTSNDGLDLGKDISSLGVQYYAIKPISGQELIDSVKSILKIN